MVVSVSQLRVGLAGVAAVLLEMPPERQFEGFPVHVKNLVVPAHGHHCAQA